MHILFQGTYILLILFLIFPLLGCSSTPNAEKIEGMHRASYYCLRNETYDPLWTVVDEEYNKKEKKYIIYYKLKREKISYKKALIDVTSIDEYGNYDRIDFEDWDGIR